jgi:hypothetical protein
MVDDFLLVRGLVGKGRIVFEESEMVFRLVVVEEALVYGDPVREVALEREK